MKERVIVEFPIHWGELDALGHVNHTRFLVWMESARMALFERVGLVWDGQPSHGPILARIEVDYLAPVHFPAGISVSAWVGRIGNTSFVINYDVRASSEQSETLVARGTSVIVTYDYLARQKCEIPDSVRAGLQLLMVSERAGP